MPDTILEYCSGRITAQLDSSRRTLVQDVRFSLKQDESLAVVGETGSGKTMTALSILQLLPRNVYMQGGTLRFLGRELPGARAMKKLLGVRIVYIPQSGLDCLDPSKKVKYHLYDSLRKLGIPSRALHRSAAEKLALAGFERPGEILEKYPFELSGGMAQRVVIAISACSEARLVIADEPTNGLDYTAKLDFRTLLDKLFPEAAKLVITHDFSVAALCGRTLVMCGGRMVETGPSDRILQAPQHPYTRALIAALVENGMQESPMLRAQQGPCPFYARCSRGSNACGTPPPRRTDGTAEWWCCAP